MKAGLTTHGCHRLILRSAALGLFVAVAGLGVGCKKQAEQSVARSTEETKLLESNVSQRVQLSQTQARPQATAVPASTSTGADLGSLTREVRRWIVRNQRPPSSFEEFASKSGVKIPPPPTGKKYELTREMSVILVDR